MVISFEITKLLLIIFDARWQDGPLFSIKILFGSFYMKWSYLRNLGMFEAGEKNVASLENSIFSEFYN
jgi:hypothetical protein